MAEETGIRITTCGCLRRILSLSREDIEVFKAFVANQINIPKPFIEYRIQVDIKDKEFFNDLDKGYEPLTSLSLEEIEFIENETREKVCNVIYDSIDRLIVEKGEYCCLERRKECQDEALRVLLYPKFAPFHLLSLTSEDTLSKYLDLNQIQHLINHELHGFLYMWLFQRLRMMYRSEESQIDMPTISIEFRAVAKSHNMLPSYLLSALVIRRPKLYRTLNNLNQQLEQLEQQYQLEHQRLHLLRQRIQNLLEFLNRFSQIRDSLVQKLISASPDELALLGKVIACLPNKQSDSDSKEYGEHNEIAKIIEKEVIELGGSIEEQSKRFRDAAKKYVNLCIKDYKEKKEEKEHVVDYTTELLIMLRYLRKLEEACITHECSDGISQGLKFNSAGNLLSAMIILNTLPILFFSIPSLEIYSSEWRMESSEVDVVILGYEPEDYRPILRFVEITTSRNLDKDKSKQEKLKYLDKLCQRINDNLDPSQDCCKVLLIAPCDLNIGDNKICFEGEDSLYMYEYREKLCIPRICLEEVFLPHVFLAKIL
ncbi:MAG: hypothetical protein QW348_08695 [Ignisphaera sp.]